MTAKGLLAHASLLTRGGIKQVGQHVVHSNLCSCQISVRSLAGVQKENGKKKYPDVKSTELNVEGFLNHPNFHLLMVGVDDASDDMLRSA